MSDSESEDSFVERDDRETRMPMGEGGVPFYIAVAWVTFIVAYIIGMSLLALPDLRAWIARP
jgi:hypothetical protein